MGSVVSGPIFVINTDGTGFNQLSDGTRTDFNPTCTRDGLNTTIWMGFVFQGFNLLARTTALENLELPMIYRGIPPAERHHNARMALRAVGLEDRETHTPAELSGGQQQRIAIARAIVTNPDLILADEPTGNLDSARSVEIMELLVRLNQEGGMTIVMVTHEPGMAAFARRVVHFKDGLIAADELSKP